VFGLKKSFRKVRGGITPGHFKHTEGIQTTELALPAEVQIYMAQNIGAPCVPTVKVGDEVKVGQVIGEWEGFIGAYVHSSVSGKVTAIDQFIMPNSNRTPMVTIKTDGLQTVSEDIKKPEVTDRESFVAAIKASGLVGLGGAGFPTWVKLCPKNLDEIDTLLINGAECEPYLTSDHRECMENGENVMAGIADVMHWLGIKKCVIGIEANKPAVIAKMQELCKKTEGVEVKVLASRYPQGAEKVVIAEALGRIVLEGQLPADVGVIIMNISTVSFIHSYLQDGMPLIKKRVTVDGNCVRYPQNVWAPVGTKIIDLVNHCGGYVNDPKKIIIGGPMMGTAIYDDNYPIGKTTNGVLFFSERLNKDDKILACIRCGACADICPMGLMPPMIAAADKAKDIDELAKLKVNLCMECGSCTYVCPSKRPITQSMREAKITMRKMGK